MALPINNELFVPINYLQTYFVDKNTGLPLSAGLVYFYQDTNRNNLKPVYQLTSSPSYQYTQLANPLTLSNAGTFVDDDGNDIAVFLYPYDAAGDPDNYYIQVFAAVPAEVEPPLFPPPPPPLGMPEFTREAVPGIIAGEMGPNSLVQQGYGNVLANSQFAEIYFNPSVGMNITYTAGITLAQIAPGWTLRIVASNGGVVSVNRTAQTGVANIPTNPPYTLTITPGPNISSLILYQRLYDNPGIFSNGFISGWIVLGSLPNGPTTIINYADSNGDNLQILSAANNTGLYNYSTATVPIGVSGNPDSANTGYVDIQIILNTVATTILTSIQVVPLAQNIQNVAYEQQTTNQQVNSLYYVDQPNLVYKQTPSFLIGWDFPFNPAQTPTFPANAAQTTTVNVPVQPTGNNSSYAIWDQTILFQSVNNGITVSRSPAGGLLLTAALDTQMCIIQYLNQAAARTLLNDNMSVNVSAKTNNGVGYNAAITLWYTKQGSVPTLPASLVATVDPTYGIPITNNGTWFKVPRGFYGDATFKIGANATTSYNNYPFSDFDIGVNADANLATYFAVVLSTTTITAGDSIDIDSISLVAGNFANRPAPQTPSAVLADCQRFYVKTFENGVLPVQALGVGTGYLTWGGTGVGGVKTDIFNYRFPTAMRTIPMVTLFNPISPNAQVRDFTASGGSDCSSSAADQLTMKSMRITSVPPGTSSTGDVLGIHITADARLGVV